MEDTAIKGSQYFWLNRHSVLAMSFFATAFTVNAKPKEPVIGSSDDSGFAIHVEYSIHDTLGTDKIYAFVQKKNFRERYKRIAKSEWFRKTHSGMSIGEVMSIEE